jgi:hypothetical protein
MVFEFNKTSKLVGEALCSPSRTNQHLYTCFTFIFSETQLTYTCLFITNI